MKKIMISVLCAVSIGVSGFTEVRAQGQQVRVPAREILYNTFEVSGVKLGMSVGATRAALEQRGFYIFREDSTGNQGWERLVEAAVAARQSREPRQTPKSVGIFEARNESQGEKIEVRFKHSPNGDVVSGVRYSISNTHMTRQAFEERVMSRWGQYGGADRNSYCLPEPRCGVISREDLLFPNLWVSSTGTSAHRIELGEGTYINGRRQKLLAAEIDRRSPIANRASF